MEDLRRRLALLDGADATIVARNPEGGGFTVEITTPYLEAST